MEFIATARYIKISPRKVRLLADLIRGKSIEASETQLKVSAKGASDPLLKLLKSAVANAQVKQVSADKLYVKSIMVNGGPVLKRFRARAFGRAAPIRKRTSHITIVLGEKQQ